MRTDLNDLSDRLIEQSKQVDVELANIISARGIAFGEELVRTIGMSALMHARCKGLTATEIVIGVDHLERTLAECRLASGRSL